MIKWWKELDSFNKGLIVFASLFCSLMCYGIYGKMQDVKRSAFHIGCMESGSFTTCQTLMTHYDNGTIPAYWIAQELKLAEMRGQLLATPKGEEQQALLRKVENLQAQLAARRPK